MRILKLTEDLEPSLRKQLKAAKKYRTILSLTKLLWLTLGIFTATTSFSSASSNLGLSSNYLWRGVTQSNNRIAESGGLDFSVTSGFYVGSWVSALSHGSFEMDLYTGFSKQISDITYDVGLISYQYPNDNDYFTESYINLTYGFLQASLAYTFDSKNNNTAEFSQGDLYYSIGVSHSFGKNYGFSTTLGHYDYDNLLGDDYNHLNVGLSKGSFSFAIDKTTGLMTNNDLVASVAWSKTFNF